MGWGRKNISYGLELDEDHVVVVRAELCGRKRHHEVLCEERLPVESGVVVKTLAHMESESRRGVAVIAGGVSVQSSVARWLTAPFASVTKARKILPALLDIQLPFSVESCVTHYLQVHREGRTVRALALAARRISVEERLQAVTELGVDPVRLDHDGLAVWYQSVEELPLEADVVRVVAYVTEQRILFVVGRAAHFENAHTCGVGFRSLKDPDAAGYQQAVESVVSRAQRVIRAYLSDPVPRSLQWVWAGAEGEVDLHALHSQLDFGLPMTFSEHKNPRSFLARALAFRALRTEDISCDFRSGDLVHPYIRKAGVARRTRVAVTYLLFGVLLCGLNSVWQGLLSFKEKQAQTVLTQRAQELAPTMTIQYGQEVRAAERALVQQESLRSPFLRVFAPSLTRVLNALLKAAQEKGIQIDSLMLRSDYISVHGVSANWSDSEGLVDVLREHGYAPEPIERQDAGADEKVHFNLKGTGSG